MVSEIVRSLHIFGRYLWYRPRYSMSIIHWLYCYYKEWNNVCMSIEKERP